MTSGISGYLRKSEGIKVSHQSIYNIIHNDTTGELAKHTRHKMKYRHRPKGRHLPIKDRLSIHERSKEVDGKRFGDFEMDLIVDPDQHAILTLVEKSINMLRMQKLPFGKQSKPLAKVVRKLLLPYKEVLSLKCVSYSSLLSLLFSFSFIFSQLLNWYIFVSSIATEPKRKMTACADGMDVLMLIVLLYFLLSLSIQFVVYIHLCTSFGKSI